MREKKGQKELSMQQPRYSPAPAMAQAQSAGIRNQAPRPPSIPNVSTNCFLIQNMLSNL